MAHLKTIITNLFIQAYGKKNSKLTTVEDFDIKWGQDEQDEKKQSVEEMKSILLGIARDQNRRVAKQNKKGN